MTVVVASRPHYADHLAPVGRSLDGEPDAAVVAGFSDIKVAQRAGFRRIALMQHGIGQSYSNRNPCYPGGDGNEAVGLFLVPNDHAADRWRAAYPDARVEVVGCPRLDDLHRRVPDGLTTVAVSFHWNGYSVPELRSAFPWFAPAVAALPQRFGVIGHGHPKRKDLPRFWARHDIEYVPTFDEVCRRADVYVCDNSSTLYEFAATGRQVVRLNSPVWRRDERHGLHFWDAAHVGVNVDDQADLVPAIERALESRPEDIAARDAALDIVYAYREGGAERAAAAITGWAA